MTDIDFIVWTHENILILCDHIDRLEAENKRLRGALEPLIHCPALVCKHNSRGLCLAETIHLQGCSSDADNVFACSEFVEQALKGK